MFGLDRTLVIAIGIAILVALGGLGFWLGLRTIDGMVTAAATAAREEQDAKWQAQIAKSNAAAEKERADQAVAAANRDHEANAAIGRLQQSLSDMEAANAALPNGDACGLGRDRVRLLPN